MDNDLPTRDLQKSTYDFALPDTSIAKTPVEPRDASRLMVLRCGTKTISHHLFRELPELLPEGTLMVRNNSRVIPARLRVRFGTGSTGELFFLTREDARSGTFFVRPGKKFPLGEKTLCFLADGLAVQVTATEALPGGERRLVWDLPESYSDMLEVLEKAGETPLPPYVGEQEDTEALRNRYQTVYASEKGSVAAPTAGLHFTDRTFADLAGRKVDTQEVTLHVGAGTFLPVKTEDLREHPMHSEWLQVRANAASTIQQAWDTHRPLVAVGTTSLRVLEHAWREKLFVAGKDVTDSTSIFIYPPQKVHGATMLLTNFHLPQSTLLMLICAFAGDTDFVLQAYNTAVKEGYRFYSFGDAMLMLP